MKNAKDKLRCNCQITRIHLEKYFEETYNVTDAKKLTSQYYTLSKNLLKSTEDVDVIIFDISKYIVSADKSGNIEKSKELTELFNVCVSYRKEIEHFFVGCENALKSDGTSLYHSLRSAADILIRKISLLETCLV